MSISRAKIFKLAAAFMASVIAFTLVFTDAAFACTTFLAGKDATTDGSRIVGRTVDGRRIQSVKIEHRDGKNDPGTWHYVDEYTGLEIDLPNTYYAMTFNSMESVEENTGGVWLESGFNSQKVSVSSTETINSNEKLLDVDPYVKNGISESSIGFLTLPYAATAREGVKWLGSLIDKYGMAASECLVIADESEIWYFENYGGHQWAAQRMP